MEKVILELFINQFPKQKRFIPLKPGKIQISPIKEGARKKIISNKVFWTPPPAISLGG